MTDFLVGWLITFVLACVIIFAVFGLVYLIGTGQWIGAGFLAAAIFATVGMITS